MNPKKLRENFAKILENPDRVDFRNFIKDHFGEQDFIDFKSDWIDSDKLAKHILAFANSEGGTIIFGIEERNGNTKIVGLKKIHDKSDIKSRMEKFLPESLEYEILDFIYKESEYADLKGKSFQLLSVHEQNKYLPFVSNSDGNSIVKNRIYVRRGTESIEPNYVELQKIINRRIDLNYSTSSEIEFEEHLTQLRTLYGQIKKTFISNSFFPGDIIDKILAQKAIPNQNYPDEDYEEFINRMIILKKNIIEKEVRK